MGRLLTFCRGFSELNLLTEFTHDRQKFLISVLQFLNILEDNETG
jgi:hypothetical protein